MGSLKKSLMDRGVKLMSDPRVMKWMRDERVLKAVVAAMSLPGKAQSFAREHAESLAKAMSLATEDEVRDLKRTVRRLEEELTQLRVEQSAPSGSMRKTS